MSEYYTRITDSTTLRQSKGTTAVAPEFHLLSSLVISRCSYLQSLIQEIIYASHGPELVEAKQALKGFPNPKARIDFLCSFPYTESDPVVIKVFDHARTIFSRVYELRNILAHESWSSSEDYPGSVLFSSLDEEARLLMASGRLWHKEDATPQEALDAMVRFIRNVKIVSALNLEAAMRDLELCAWMLMNISSILKEDDPERKEKARQAFFVFKGTSHLFPGAAPSSTTIEFHSSRNKRISKTP